MAHLCALKRVESVELDYRQLTLLYRQMGTHGAETVIARASQELDSRLQRCEQLWRMQEAAALRKCARSTIAIAEQIGMEALARVARDVTIAADQGDRVAVAATLARLRRIGQESLRAVWQMRGVSV
ncbi:hypothetical protein [Pseudodonghicola flavimaris]|uniref:HPt domain-containing protein n=1 Tax=Pseudodonghicola flavimaris TaxID=3050036 RepID=A0ABT7F7E2_9RHOB|nr:hypothetical protein [Pseudodonghicola flavimaris]MDK3020309.1 hypothetical protein [Pseudodonghicola flavimaris]